MLEDAKGCLKMLRMLLFKNDYITCDFHVLVLEMLSHIKIIVVQICIFHLALHHGQIQMNTLKITKTSSRKQVVPWQRETSMALEAEVVIQVV